MDTIILETVTQETIETYINVGKKSYEEHYLHLWENEDPSPYINSSFSRKVVENELADVNVANYLVKMGDAAVGIVKIIIDHPLDELSEKDSLLAQKIYLLQAYSGMGIGKKVLQLIEDHARGLGKKVVWLDTMQKGGPIKFYLKNGFKIKKESEIKLPGAKPSEKPMWVLTKEL